MIVSIILGIVFFVIVLIGLHFVHDWYKEKQWRSNNPDELLWTEQPVKKDPGLE
jgi:heme/copper-type cytochrome/quinol oxidase subunit 2